MNRNVFHKISMVLLAIMMAWVLLFSSGCSHVNRIDLDGRTLYHVTTWDLVAPNTVTLMMFDERPVVVNGGVGSGVIDVVGNPIAAAYGAHEIGKGIGKSGSTTNISNDSENNSVNENDLDNSNTNKNVNTNDNKNVNKNDNKNTLKNNNTNKNTNNNTLKNTNTNKNDIKNTLNNTNKNDIKNTLNNKVDLKNTNTITNKPVINNENKIDIF